MVGLSNRSIPFHLESSTCGRMSLYKNDEPLARRFTHGRTRDTDALSCGALYTAATPRRGVCVCMWVCVWDSLSLNFSYPSFGMDPTTPPDVGRHGYLSFRGCTSACWSPARATTGRRRSPSPARGHWCNPRYPSCTGRPSSSRCPVHRLQDRTNRVSVKRITFPREGMCRATSLFIPKMYGAIFRNAKADEIIFPLCIV